MLITEAVAQRKSAPIYLARGQQHKFHSLIGAEEEAYDARLRKESGMAAEKDQQSMGSFQEYREKSTAAM